MRIDDRQLDEALRTIAVPPAPPDLPARVLRDIHETAPNHWWSTWRPALGVAMGVMAITLMAQWMRAPGTPREAQGSGRMAQGSEAVHLGTAAPPHARTSAPQEAQDSGLMAHDVEAPHLLISAPSPRPTSAPERRRLLAESVEGLPALDAPEPLSIARVQTPEFSQSQLQVDVIHVPALEVETLDR